MSRQIFSGRHREGDFNLWPVELVGNELLELELSPAGMALKLDGQRVAFMDALEVSRVLHSQRPKFTLSVLPKLPGDNEPCPLCKAEPVKETA